MDIDKLKDIEYKEFNDFIDLLIVKYDKELLDIEKILNKIEKIFEKRGYRNISREDILRYLDII